MSCGKTQRGVRKVYYNADLWFYFAIVEFSENLKYKLLVATVCFYYASIGFFRFPLSFFFSAIFKCTIHPVDFILRGEGLPFLCFVNKSTDRFKQLTIICKDKKKIESYHWIKWESREFTVEINFGISRIKCKFTKNVQRQDDF